MSNAARGPKTDHHPLGRCAFVRKAAGFIALAATSVTVASCVVSDKSLVANAKPLLGQNFDMVLYRDFREAKGFSAQQVSYRWEAGAYERKSESPSYIVRFAAEPLQANDFLVERSQAERTGARPNVFSYWIARKITGGTYVVFPVNELDMSSEDRKSICADTAPEGFCSVKSHEDIVTAARASADKPPRDPYVGILVDESVRASASTRVVKSGQE